jgi:hypothetical protein
VLPLTNLLYGDDSVMNQGPTIEKISIPIKNLMRAVAIACGILFLFLFSLPAKTYAIGVGDIAPDFKITTLDGKELSYQQDIKAKKPLYLIFWATW